MARVEIDPHVEARTFGLIAETDRATATLVGTHRFFQDLAVALHAFGAGESLSPTLRRLRDELDRTYVQDPSSRVRRG